MLIRVKEGRKWISINSEEILFIKASNIYCEIYFKNSEKIICTSTLSQLENELRMENFVRTHRSFLVNKKTIYFFDKQDLTLSLLDSEFIIPVSRYKRKILTEL